MRLLKKKCLMLVLLLLHVLIVHATVFSTSFSTNTPYELLSKNICDITGLPVYNTSLKKGESFLHVVFPGLSFTISEFSFSGLLGKELYGNTKEINKAYRFAKIVNGVFNPQLRTLVPDYFLEKYAQDGQLVMSTTYNDTFCPTFVIPFLQEFQWVSYQRTDTLSGDALSVFSISLARLNLERGWLDSSKLSSHKILSPKAYIKELLIARRLQWSLFGENKASPAMQIEGDDDTMILGMICIML